MKTSWEPGSPIPNSSSLAGPGELPVPLNPSQPVDGTWSREWIPWSLQGRLPGSGRTPCASQAFWRSSCSPASAAVEHPAVPRGKGGSGTRRSQGALCPWMAAWGLHKAPGRARECHPCARSGSVPFSREGSGGSLPSSTCGKSGDASAQGWDFGTPRISVSHVLKLWAAVGWE